MGIKGIYRELGPGKRVSLSKLTADSFATADRPFRIAIDIAIWQFQGQAARGGTNPAIRTLFYRLVRLLGTPIQPIFVFDGPNKPKFKRNKRSGKADGVATAQAKRLIRLFGFVTHDAPGEAEAECALIQKNGIVDAVLSEDVDTIMFGCTKTLRNWSAEGTSSKTPTHVSMYDVEEMNIASLGLDREGMVLVALMSGGDYLPEGVPGCGVRTACEAAKGGFGRSVCRLKASDTDGIRRWRESLTHELHTNENGHFRTRHKALTIPDDFPNMEILRYYTHPVVSQGAALAALEQKLVRNTEVQLEALREFARETFDWDYREGAIKFIRVLGQAMLVNKLQQRDSDSEASVKKVTGRRTHFSTDGSSELRLSFVPEEIVPIDLSREVQEDIAYGRHGLALNSDEEFEAPMSSMGDEPSTGTGKTYDVTKPNLAWVLEGIARKSVPRVLRAWEEAQQARARPKSPKKGGRSKSKKTAPAPPSITLDAFYQTTKPTGKSTEIFVEKTHKSKDGRSKSREMVSFSQLRETAVQQPPKGTSKQPWPTAATSSADRDCFVSSSPMTPRVRRGVERIDAPSGPSRGARPQTPPPAERQGHDAASSPGEVGGGVARRPAQGMTATSSKRATRLTQTSMDMFTKTTKPSPKAAEDDKADVEIISLSDPESPAQQRSKGRDERRKLKLLVFKTSGFFDEIEVSEDEYEERIAKESRLLESRGIRGGVARWSDVSVIDLTKE